MLLTLFSLVAIQKRISQGLKVLQYYTTKNWTFKNEKFLQMKKNMTPKDLEMFYFSVEEVKGISPASHKISKNMNKRKGISKMHWLYHNSIFFQIDWDEYIGHYILGARHFLLKEKPETLPKARVLLRRLYLLDKLVSVLLYALIFWIIYSYWNSIIYSFESVLDHSAGFINQRFTKVFNE